MCVYVCMCVRACVGEGEGQVYGVGFFQMDNALCTFSSLFPVLLVLNFFIHIFTLFFFVIALN